MRVRWTHTALGHLTAIYEYIGRDSPRYARRIMDRITLRSRQIGRLPESGQMVPEYQDLAVREVIVGSFRILYQVTSDEILVLAVIHGARQLPPEPPREGNS